MARFAATNEQARRRFFPGQETLFAMDFADLPQTPDLADPATLPGTAIDLALHEMARSATREAEAAMAQYRLLRRLDDRRTMRMALVRAIKFAPDMLAPRLRLAELFLDEGDMLQANEHIEAAARIAPDEPRVRTLRRRAEKGRGQGPSAPATVAARVSSLSE
jgi:hypothetical protein